ncbi:hypothetical protein [Paraburkholderia sp.]|uniref:hypothetical protein n=1 Tax=Paraburkholderia sp. TaxID=1926495 RepID=UPI0039E2A5A8
MPTDIGIGLLIAMLVRGERTDNHARHVEQLRLHGFTVLAFCVGGVLVVIAYKALGALLLLVL